MQLFVRYVVAAVLHSMLYPGYREHGTVQANEHHEDSKAAVPRIVKESQLRASRIRKNRLGTKREAGFHECSFSY